MSVLTDLMSKINTAGLAIDKVEKAIKYLQHYGYLAESGTITITDIIEAVKEFQSFFGLDTDGVLSPKVVRAMDGPRCGCSDAAKFAEAVARWNKTNLTYFVQKTVSGLDPTAAVQQIHAAWSEWEKITNISLTQVSDPNANIIITIGAGPKDNFDGPSGCLAWAYLPNGADGQLLMEFDDSETWVTDPTQRGILIKNVACHEFGHLLGLDHSKSQGALMAPYYNPSIDKPQSVDDIPRIQSLYGVKTTPTPTPTPTPTDPGTGTGPTKKVTLVLSGDITNVEMPGYRITKIGK